MFILGRILWLHRTAVKYSEPGQHYLPYNPMPRAWTHVGRQGKYDGWVAVYRKYSPDHAKHLMLPHPDSQSECFPTTAQDAQISEIDQRVWGHFQFTMIRIESFCFLLL